MENKKLDEKLEQLKSNFQYNPEEFDSVEEFKKRFHKNVECEERQKIRHLRFFVAVAAAACVVLGIVGVPMYLASDSVKDTAVVGQARTGVVAQIEQKNAPSAPAAPRTPPSSAPISSEPEMLTDSAMPAVVNAPVMANSAPPRILGRMSAPRPQFKGGEQVKFNTEEYKSLSENSFFKVLDKPLSTFGADVDSASYTNVRRYIMNRNRLPDRDMVRIEEFINFFRYDYPEVAENEKFSVTFESMTTPWNPEHKLLLIGMQAKEMPLGDLPPSNYVFLVDNSGSMRDDLELVREGLLALANEIRSVDRISLVTYGGGVNVLLDGVAGGNKNELIEAIKKLQCGGYTPGADGIQTAYKLAHKHFTANGNNRIVLVTDGDFNVGVSSEAELVAMVEKERASFIYLSTFGVGEGNYQENKLKMLANKGNGNFYYIDNIREARYAMQSCFAGRMFTLARDVKFQIEFNPSQVSAYRLLGYEMRHLEDYEFNDDSRDSGEVGMGHQVTAIYEIVPASSSNVPGGSVDELRYQSRSSKNSGEILTLKLRYQNPGDNQPSILRTFTLKAMPKASDNIRWSAAVAEFALILRDSPHKGNASIANVLELARSAMGKDSDGRRAEFLTMVHAAGNLLKK